MVSSWRVLTARTIASSGSSPWRARMCRRVGVALEPPTRLRRARHRERVPDEPRDRDAQGDRRRVVVRDRAEDRVAPQCGRRTRVVRDDHRCDVHHGAVAGGALRSRVPRRTVLVSFEERPHGAAEAVDAAAVGEGGGETVGDDVAVLEDVLERPEGELRVVGREADDAAAGVAVRQVVADLAVLAPAATA